MTIAAEFLSGIARRQDTSDAPGRGGSLQNCWMGFESSRSCCGTATL